MPDIGIDLGTANVLVYARGKGIVIQEPSVVAMDRDSNKILAVGEEARQMLGRTPGNILVIRPVKSGVIAKYDVTETTLKYFIHKVCGKRPLFRPRVVVCVPSGITTVEQRAVVDACTRAGAKKVFLISEPMAAAIGAGLPIETASGNMVVDIGGGTTDVAVISLGGIVVSESLRIGGDDFDDAIIRYVKRVHNLAIGLRTAESIKIDLARALSDWEPATMSIRRRDLVSGLPKTIDLPSAEVYTAIKEHVMAIASVIKTVLETTPPELSADIIEQGITLTGGGALLRGMDQLITAETGIRTFVAEDPTTCVGMGTGIVLESLDKWARSPVLSSYSA